MEHEDENCAEVNISSDSFSDHSGLDGEEWPYDALRNNEVEEHEYTTPGDNANTVDIYLFFFDDRIVECPWIQDFGVICTSRDGVTVATAKAHYIDRERIHHDFRRRMVWLGGDMSDLALDVFDQYGTIKSKFKEHPVHKGSGVWGDELDHGPLFVIEQFHVVAPELRRKGLGQRIVSLLLSKAERYSLRATRPGVQPLTLHALVLPGWLKADVHLASKSPREEHKLKTQAKDALSTRLTPFALASDFQPPIDFAHHLEDEDLDGAVSWEIARDRRSERLRKHFPLHHAASTIHSDDECRALFENCTLEEADWTKSLKSGQTPLHITALLKPRTLEWLLENIDGADSLKAYRTVDGYTPREVLEEYLELERSMAEVSGGFKGHHNLAVASLSLLADPATSMLSNACLRYGCTCGKCLEGFLSPRMSMSLIWHAENLFKMLNNKVEDDAWIRDNYQLLVHLNSNGKRNLANSEPCRQGFLNTLHVVMQCLKAKKIPTSENIAGNTLEPHTHAYLRLVGTQHGCHAILRLLFDYAKERDEKAGNGATKRGLKESWSTLPTCRNDHEFEFAATTCGYPGKASGGFPF
ncbi:hypothetical protein BJX66DRAFT_338795 [Aspergillus keveii]|uniref:N-acetyltransferase domain-containing protein n=1 Tax=Aspergillus keveii TaxID=714993 RepID=A0ABR4G394_9EURO